MRDPRPEPPHAALSTDCPGSWSVVATTLPDESLVIPFIAHHLAIGAREVFLFVDSNAIPESMRLHEDPRIRVTACDDQHWAATCGSRPGHIGARQMANAAVARRAATADWMLHCDTDEFLAAERGVSDTLAQMPDHVFSILLDPWEAVFDREPSCVADALATPLFRHPLPSISEPACQRLYGGFRGLTLHGLAGHIAGKSIVRRSMTIGVDSVHRPLPADPSRTALARVSDMGIAHFHAPTFARWLAKWGGDPELEPGPSLRRRREHVKQAITLVHDRLLHHDLDALHQAFRSLYVFDDPDRLALAQEIGLVTTRSGLVGRRNPS